jgi:MFS family permease
MPSDAEVEARARSTRGATALLRSPRYRTLWIVGLAIAFSVLCQNVARAWLARKLTGTNAGLGAVLFAFGVPSVALAPIAGVLADRFPKRRVMMLSQCLMIGGSLVIGCGLLLGALEYWMLLVSAAMHGAAFVVFGPVLMSFSAEVVERVQIARAVTLHYLGAEAMRVIGPSVGGAIIAMGRGGQKFVFLGGAVIFLSTVLSMMRMPKSAPRRLPGASPFADLRAGISYVRGRRHLRLLLATFLVVVIFATPYMAFLPTIAKRYDVGADGFGFMTGVGALGALAGAGFAAWRGVRGLMGRMTAGGVLFGVAVVALSLAPSYAVALVVMPFVGVGSVLFLTSGQALIMTLSDLDYHGRMQGVLMIGITGWGLAALPLGMVADRIGLRATLIAMGVVAVVASANAALRASKDRTLLATRDLG